MTTGTLLDPYRLVVSGPYRQRLIQRSGVTLASDSDSDVAPAILTLSDSSSDSY